MRSSALHKTYEEDNIIRVMTYEEWEKIREIKTKRTKRLAKYYRRQRAFGFYICLVAMVFYLISSFTNVFALTGIANVFAVLGLFTMFTRKMILVDSYFIEKKRRG